MANLQDKPVPPVAGLEAGEKEALFRRAAQVTHTAQLLINETEQLMEQTRQLLQKSDDEGIPE